MKKIVVFVLFLGGLYFGYQQSRVTPMPEPSSQVTPSPERSPTSTRSVGDAWDQQESGRQVQGSGTVTRILSDDNDGSRHQRFVLALASGQTLLIAHNIDLAPRIPSLGIGDTVAFYGEYEWNDKGGVIHWTHLDPQGTHAGGWLEHEGRRYE